MLGEDPAISCQSSSRFLARILFSPLFKYIDPFDSRHDGNTPFIKCRAVIVEVYDVTFKITPFCFDSLVKCICFRALFFFSPRDTGCCCSEREKKPMLGRRDEGGTRGKQRIPEVIARKFRHR